MQEIGITGGEEDGVNNEDVDNNSPYTPPEDILQIYKTLEPISPYFSIAAGFGNVHGVYKVGLGRGSASAGKAGRLTWLSNLARQCQAAPRAAWQAPGLRPEGNRLQALQARLFRLPRRLRLH